MTLAVIALILLYIHTLHTLSTFISWCVLLAIVYGVVSWWVGRSAPAMSTRRKLMLASWEPSTDGTVFSVITCNAEPLQAYMDKAAKAGLKITPTIAVIKALAMAYRVAPSINGRITLGRFIPHSSIDISCLVAMDDGKDLANAKITNADNQSLQSIASSLKAKADKLRAHKDEDFESSKPLLSLLPVWALKIIVYVVGWLSAGLGLNIPALGVRQFPFGSALVTSVGMLGVEQAFVPFTPFARVPVLLMVGAIVKKPVVNATDEIIVQRVLTMTVTLDHRFADGTQASQMANRLKYILEHPQEMEA